MNAEEIGEKEWAAVDSYIAKRQAGVRAMVFSNFMTTCDRLLPQTGALTKGMRFAVHGGDNQPRVLVEVIEEKGDLYFAIFSSRDEKIPCQPQDFVIVSVLSVYKETKPKGTPRLPTTKEEWNLLAGRGSLKLRLWYLLCRFKKFCDYHYYSSQNKKR